MTAIETSKPNLLLVEDDVSAQAALVRLLRTAYDLKTCESAEEALALLQNGLEPDIVLSDYGLPIKSGLDFLAKVKEVSPDSVRVLITGRVLSPDLAAALESGILHRIFLKPWENSLLLLQIQEALQQRRLLQNSRILEQKSSTDGLTGLLNKKIFQESLTKEIDRADRHQRPLSLVLLDLDQFKSINDEHGHSSGDRALILVSNVLKKMLRNIDLTARIGGDEFAIILPETSVERAQEIAERIRLAVIKDALTEKLDLSVSLGVAGTTSSGRKAEELFEIADQALYQAKRNGRNQSVVADSLKPPVK